MIVSAQDKYEVFALPNDFKIINSKYVLNDNGQVAGTYAPSYDEITKYNASITIKSVSKKDPLVGSKAAYWSTKEGIVTIPLEGYVSHSCDINNNGIIVGVYKSEISEKERVFYWDTTTGKVIVGPQGIKCFINSDNIVCIINADRATLWDTKDNSVQFIKISNLDDSWQRIISLRKNYVNSKGTMAYCIGEDIYVKQGSKEKLMMNPKGKIKGTPLINELDEIISMAYLNDSSKSEYFIVKWHPDNSVTTSDHLSSYKLLDKDFWLIAFNNKRQIFLSSWSGLYLLTPIS